jgi:hypothetical protein
MAELIQPKELVVELPDGGAKKYVISKFPAIQGREIVAKYPTSALPKIGDYAVSEEVMLKLMGFVAAESSGNLIRLATQELVNNHVPDWETLAKIEMAMMEYNCSFFRKGTLSASLADIAQKSLQKIIETLTLSSESSSPQARPPSTNSEPSTP